MIEHAEDDSDDLKTGATATIAFGGEPATTLVAIAIKDRPLAALAVEFIRSALERAEKQLVKVRCESPDVRRRLAATEELQQRLNGTDELTKAALNLGLPARLIDTLKVGLLMELQAALDLVDEQGKLALDPAETEERIKRLQDMLAHLDVAALGAETEES